MVNFLRVLSQNEKLSETKPPFKGQLKLSIEYRKDVLHVMICHAKDLAIPDGSKDEPNSYVKVYLRPDPHKATKRKTRVVRKNRHPSFMEMVSSRGMYIVHNELNKVMLFSSEATSLAAQAFPACFCWVHILVSSSGWW